MPETPHKTPDERAEYGKSLRKKIPRESHGQWSPAKDRPDPVNLLEEQNQGRLEWLVPVRRSRMSVSAFAFFRAGARLMASDLVSTPVTGLSAQICGDAHLDNFGLFASPERQLVFDINDFDETLAGPWEWDIKRLAASFIIAARHNDLKKGDANEVTERVVKTYRKSMAKFASMRTTDVWYALLDESEFIDAADDEGRKRQAQKITDKAKSKDSLQALDKLAELVGEEYQIKSAPPDVIPLRELQETPLKKGKELRSIVNQQFEQYQQSLPDHYRYLLERFQPVDAALKVVGVGSVGNVCMIMLLEGRGQDDPLFLQLKEAGPSVLEEFLPPGPYKNHGQRVVEGQHLMQSVSDVFLGWTEGQATGIHYYWRQLRDWKGSLDVENAAEEDLYYYAPLCGWTLARAHARSGDPVAISAYLGSSDTFDKALVDFANTYADQNERDYEAFMEEIKSGRLECSEG